MSDYNREVLISFEAAQRDINNLNSAMNTLKDANAAVSKLLSTASGMQGQTGAAIVAKAQQIAQKLSSLESNLMSASQAIHSAVEEKRQADAEAARVSQSGGI